MYIITDNWRYVYIEHSLFTRCDRAETETDRQTERDGERNREGVGEENLINRVLS